MNHNLDKLIVEATKFVKISRYLLLAWVVAYCLYFGLAIFSSLYFSTAPHGIAGLN